MIKVQVCLAFPFDAHFAEACKKTNPHLIELFTKNSDYLQWITVDKQKYLGKFCPSSISFEELQNLALHLKSLAKQLAPQIELKACSLHLLSLQDDLSGIA